MTMKHLKNEIRRECPDWRFLTQILGEHRENRPTMGVNARGLVLVNPFYARQVGVTRLVKMIRAELALANELSKTVRFFGTR
jgi:hypothetical protein